MHPQKAQSHNIVDLGRETWDLGAVQSCLLWVLSDVVAGVYGESGTGGRYRALTVSVARRGRCLSGLPRPAFVMTRSRPPTGLDSP